MLLLPTREQPFWTAAAAFENVAIIVHVVDGIYCSLVNTDYWRKQWSELCNNSSITVSYLRAMIGCFPNKSFINKIKYVHFLFENNISLSLPKLTDMEEVDITTDFLKNAAKQQNLIG